MTELPEDALSEAERRALHSLHEDSLPPPELEDQVILALKARALLRSRPAKLRWRLRAAVAAAAFLLVFLAGAAVGARLPSPPPPPSGPQFVLFLLEGEGFRAPLPGTERTRIAEYREWVRHLGESGIQVSGEKLKEGAEILGGPPGGSAPGGASPGTGFGALGGYFIVGAKDVGQARKIASTCPHLLHGGSLVIRQIDPV